MNERGRPHHSKLTDNARPGEQPHPERPQRDFARAQQLAAVAAAVIAALTLALGVYTQLIRTPGDITPSPSPTPHAIRSATSSTNSVRGEVREATDAFSVGSCVQGATTVPCDASHDREVISAGTDCTRDTLLDYLGGSAVDVLRPDLVVSTSQTHGCTVGLSGATLSSSLKQMLPTSSGAALRWCRADNGATMQCTFPHGTEVVHQRRPGSTEELNCPGRLARYTEKTWPELSDSVRVDAERINNVDSCVVHPLGDNLFTNTLRGLRRSQIPLAGRT